MGSAARIRDILPSLWRPEPEEEGLLAELIAAIGAQLDQARIEAGDTMQAHWAAFADSALLSTWMAAARRRARKRPLLPSDPEVEAHPFVDDLARLASLLGLVPYGEPLDSREGVEAFRRRVFATLRLWQEGISTRAGLFDAARLALSGLPERALAIEEFAPAAPHSQAVAMPGAPTDMVGPLMRWRTESRALLPTPVEIYVHGVAPADGRIDATENPVVELFDPATGCGTGLAYEGSVAEGTTLALLPAHSSWIGGGPALLSATSLPSASAPADPTAAGGWAAVEDGPPPPVAALAQTADGALWAAVAGAGEDGGALWRLTDAGWTEAFGGLPGAPCLLAEEDRLLVGHGEGLARLAVFEDPPALSPDPGAAGGPAVHALARGPSGELWAATSKGVARVDAAGGLDPVGPGARPETETPLRTVQIDEDGIVHFGGAAGLFRFDPPRSRWHVYRGGSDDEADSDWAAWDAAAGALPEEADTFLPEVTALLRGPDMSLWIGTVRGLARYRANGRRGAYAARLEAFPELGTGPVHVLALDERQRLWVGTGRGLLVGDGTDWFQMRGGELVRLPRRAAGQSDRAWRFDRADGAWESKLPGDAGGFGLEAPEPVTSEEGPVTTIGWTDGAVARIGTMSDGGFAADDEIAPGQLRRRVKPMATRIVEGFLPAVPRIGPGEADFRYLALEDDSPPPPKTFPAWTREGRLLPPPDEAAAPGEGRYLAAAALRGLDTVFAYNPAARVTLRWRPRAALSVTARLERQAADETLPPVVLDRIASAMDLVRPAGARVRVAHGEALVRGDEDG